MNQGIGEEKASSSSILSFPTVMGFRPGYCNCRSRGSQRFLKLKAQDYLQQSWDLWALDLGSSLRLRSSPFHPEGKVRWTPPGTAVKCAALCSPCWQGCFWAVLGWFWGLLELQVGLAAPVTLHCSPELRLSLVERIYNLHRQGLIEGDLTQPGTSSVTGN